MSVVVYNSGVAMGCAGCAMHKGPAVRGPCCGVYSGISFLLSDTEYSQINWNLRFSTRQWRSQECELGGLPSLAPSLSSPFNGGPGV